MKPGKHRAVRWALRAARPADLDDLDRLEAGAFGVDRMARRQLRYHIKNRKAQFLVIADPKSGAVCGAILTLFNKRGFARIYSVVLHRDLRGQGLAKKMIRAAIRETKRRGIDCITLEVRRDNKAATGLYLGMGFEKIGILRSYYKDNMDGLKMLKHI